MPECDFRQMARKCSDVGIANDNNCVIEVVDGTYRVIASRAAAEAYKPPNRNGDLTFKRIELKEEYQSIDVIVRI